ncbi:DNA-directed DNA polymerase, family B, multifunctional domain-containing protein [Rozella allomycis CSF55]|uniref:DNA polymerase n=1 Tax=Rozella allomycis (strain CSF55) TaxID=988480 RepID=A0A075AV61_ROZAC|nr:DNA-directed DNA polymerase, family B, multifunctional domain-containing protein [Rozella allomycis CSF55]|eukprot:EPZ34123.1 DNA-directed DNA polymerase, family B, multifunctional domain-containing protein [Rozella allomycis CSF55]
MKFTVLDIQPIMRRGIPQVDDIPMLVKPEPMVPVIRMVGQTDSRRSITCYVHHVYPYFYINFPFELDRVEEMLEMIHQKLELEKIAVYKLVLVKGRNMYGYEKELGLFVKVMLCVPNQIEKAARMLQDGKIMDFKFDVYEVHIPFTLQFMMDYGIYGMGEITVSNYRHRLSNDEIKAFKSETGSRQRVISEISSEPISEDLMYYEDYKDERLKKESVCEIEIDTFGFCIMNRMNVIEERKKLNRRNGMGYFSKEECCVPSLKSIWRDEKERREEKNLTQVEWKLGNNESEIIEDLNENLIFDEKEEYKDIPFAFESIELSYPKIFLIRGLEPLILNLKPNLIFSNSSLRIFSTQQTQLNNFGNRNEDLDEFLDNLFDGQLQGDDVEGEEVEGEEKIDVDFREDVEIEEDELMNNGEEINYFNIENDIFSSLNDNKDSFNKYKVNQFDGLDGSDSHLSNPHLSDSHISDSQNSFIESSIDKFKNIDWEISLLDESADEIPNGQFEDVEVDEEIEEVEEVVGVDEDHFVEEVTFDEIESMKNNDLESNEFYLPNLSIGNEMKFYTFKSKPPSVNELIESLNDFNLTFVENLNPIFSNPDDINQSEVLLHGQRFTLKSINDLDEFKPIYKSVNVEVEKSQTINLITQKRLKKKKWFEFITKPPKIEEFRVQERVKSQVESPTPRNTFNFKFTQINNKERIEVFQNMTILSMELYSISRGSLKSDPEFDEIKMISIYYHKQGFEDYLIFSIDERKCTNFKTINFSSEIEMIRSFINKFKEIDPDFCCGFEIHQSSFGYLIERSLKKYEINIIKELSRMKSTDERDQTRVSDNARDHTNNRDSVNNAKARDNNRDVNREIIEYNTNNIKDRALNFKNDKWNYNVASGIFIPGRIMLNIWRLIKQDQNLRNYNFDTTVYHILHQKVPEFDQIKLLDLFKNRKYVLIDHILNKAICNLELLAKIDFIFRTSEFARVFGVDFYSVISRGSQFKVESMMLRMAKREDFIPFSPNANQINSMNAAQGLPLVMEPNSKFYVDPVVVLDFQSLYPSLMIAYNYCYTTCLGNDKDKLGASNKSFNSNQFSSNDVFVAPNNVKYVKKHIREGLLGRMLMELLETRIMIKNSMKIHKVLIFTFKLDLELKRTLDARQLGIKYISNVTYGYTSASFSGRMPCVDIADSIVLSGRQTLEKTIAYINSHPKWNANVVYGDTDSVFVLLKGRTKDQAFDIGNEIANEITNLNPKPIKLKFEKKRYCGFKYESKDQIDPILESKGTEIIRRDSCQAVSKIQENSLKILARTNDLSKVKEYLYKEWNSILGGHINVYDFIFFKKVKFGSYKSNTLPPAAHLAAQVALNDSRSVPEYAERVSYLVAYRQEGNRLVDFIVSPKEFLDKKLRLHSTYYITKQIIPSLDRVFCTMGIKINDWYMQMPRTDRIKTRLILSSQPTTTAKTIDQFYLQGSCLICRQPIASSIVCLKCTRNKQETVFYIANLINQIEKVALANLKLVSELCTWSSS